MYAEGDKVDIGKHGAWQFSGLESAAAGVRHL